ncbi:MAG: hypothetical protein EHM93_07320 [Bacteroidales bacterium]|nr:MAG: hypothetical protein EHM93_07320 [Bacteroidales bacterium]
MIVWSGRGILSFLVFLIVLIVSGLCLPKEYAYYGYVIASFLAGIFSWFIGIKWNNQEARPFIDEKTGQRVILKPNHALFWIRMQYWGPIFWIFGSLFLAYKSILASIISVVILIAYIIFEHTKQNRSEEQNTTKVKIKKVVAEKEKEKVEREERERKEAEEERLKRRLEKEDPSRFMPK